MRALATDIWATPPVESTDRPLLAIIRGEERTLMVDGGNSPAHADCFRKALSASAHPEPDFIAITHSHCDHIFGLSSLGGLVLANRRTQERIKELQSLSWGDDDVAARVLQGTEHPMTAQMLQAEMPGDRSGFRPRNADVVYDTRLEVELGGLTCTLEMIGGDHCPDSTVVFVPARKLLFLGDCLYLRHKDEQTVGELQERLLSYAADLYIDSHREQPLTRNQIGSKSYLKALLPNDT